MLRGAKSARPEAQGYRPVFTTPTRDSFRPYRHNTATHIVYNALAHEVHMRKHKKKPEKARIERESSNTAPAEEELEAQSHKRGTSGDTLNDGERPKESTREDVPADHKFASNNEVRRSLVRDFVLWTARQFYLNFVIAICLLPLCICFYWLTRIVRLCYAPPYPTNVSDQEWSSLSASSSSASLVSLDRDAHVLALIAKVEHDFRAVEEEILASEKRELDDETLVPAGQAIHQEVLASDKRAEDEEVLVSAEVLNASLSANNGEKKKEMALEQHSDDLLELLKKNVKEARIEAWASQKKVKETRRKLRSSNNVLIASKTALVESNKALRAHKLEHGAYLLRERNSRRWIWVCNKWELLPREKDERCSFITLINCSWGKEPSINQIGFNDID